MKLPLYARGGQGFLRKATGGGLTLQHFHLACGKHGRAKTPFLSSGQGARTLRCHELSPQTTLDGRRGKPQLPALRPPPHVQPAAPQVHHGAEPPRRGAGASGGVGLRTGTGAHPAGVRCPRPGRSRDGGEAATARPHRGTCCPPPPRHQSVRGKRREDGARRRRYLRSLPPPPRTSARAQGLRPALRHLSPPRPSPGAASGEAAGLPQPEPEPEPEPEPRSPAAAAAAALEDAPGAGALTSPAAAPTAARGLARSTPGNVVPLRPKGLPIPSEAAPLA